MRKTEALTFKYLLFTFLITYIFWWSIAIANKFGYLEYGTAPMMSLYLIGGNAPVIAAVILLTKSRLITGKELLKEAFKIKQKLIFYIFALFVLFLYYAIPLALGNAGIISPIYIILLMFPLMIIGGGLEEVGWRYLLQSNLENKIPFAGAVLVTYFFWVIWHLPLFFIEGTNQFTWNFGIFAVNVLGLSFVLAALFRISKSLWMCIFLHSLINAVGECISVDNSYLSAAIITLVLIVVSICTVIVDNLIRNKSEGLS